MHSKIELWLNMARRLPETTRSIKLTIITNIIKLLIDNANQFKTITGEKTMEIKLPTKTEKETDKFITNCSYKTTTGKNPFNTVLVQ